MMNVLGKVFLGLGVWCLTVGLTMSVFGRDPFFPLGYEIKKDLPVNPPVSKGPQVPSKITERREVTSSEWDVARKTLQMNGFASAGGNRQVVLINGKSYRGGEKVSITYQGVVFTWRVEVPEEHKVNLVPLEAVRSYLE